MAPLLSSTLAPRPIASLHRIGILCAILIASCLVSAGRAETATPPESEHTNWPRFRGPGGNAWTTEADFPVTCDVKSGANVAWSAPVPAAGFGSPIIWGDRVFLSGESNGTGQVLCFDTATGKLLWQQAAPKPEGAPEEAAEIPDQSGLAAGTPATDGQRVYAMFANGDMVAFNVDGKLAWAKHLGVPKNPYGHATSLITWKDRVIVQFDQGDLDDHLSKLYALDGATGKVVWETPRPVGASWATPLVAETGGQPELITLGLPLVAAYNPADGKEIWRASCLDGEVTPSPIYVGGTLYVISPTTKLQIIRPDGHGDVTKTHLGWVAEDNIPDVTSPVSNGEFVYLANTDGTFTCYNAKSGKKEWEQDLNDECKASPSIAGPNIYVITKKGTMITMEAGAEFKEVGRSALGEQVYASPAFAKGKIFVRGLKHLICLEVGKHL